MSELKKLGTLLVFSAFCCASKAAPAPCEYHLTNEEPYVWIRPPDGALAPRFYRAAGMSFDRGTPQQRAEASFGASGLLERHKRLIPAAYPILEVGTFITPLANMHENENPWLVWDADENTALRIVNSHPARATVFLTDLERLSPDAWPNFIQANREALWLNRRPIMLGAAILSSVLTPSNYQGLLDAVMEMMQPGGLVILTHARLKEPSSLTSNRIVEYIFTNFADRIEVLEGTRYASWGVEDERPALQMAFRVREPQPPQNLYRTGILMMVDYHAPYEVRFPNGVTSENGRSVIREWNHFNREGKVQWYESQYRTDIESVRLVRKISETADLIRNHLETTSGRAFFPEREILLRALEIPNPARRGRFLDRELGRLYRRLGRW